MTPSLFQTVYDARRRVKERIDAAAFRRGFDNWTSLNPVTLVAVTKSATPQQIAALAIIGQRDFAENRVQQLEQRIAALPAEIANLQSQFAELHPTPSSPSEVASTPSAIAALIRWHMIGHLQRNKVKQVVPLVRLIHSVDSLRLAEEINAFAGKRAATDVHAKPVDVLLQVNIAEEEQKYGLGTADAPALAAQVAAMPHVRLRGLMTMAPYSDDAESSRPVFAQAAELFARLRTEMKQEHFDTLSMGMTNDYEVAIEEGATVVRVGRALFGE